MYKLLTFGTGLLLGYVAVNFIENVTELDIDPVGRILAVVNEEAYIGPQRSKKILKNDFEKTIAENA